MNTLHNTLYEWFQVNTSPEMKEDLKEHYGIDFDWVCDRIHKAGLKFVLNSSITNVQMRFGMKLSGPKSQKLLFQFLVVDWSKPNPIKNAKVIYEENTVHPMPE